MDNTRRKTIAILLQVIMIVMIFTNHFLVIIFFYAPVARWFGLKVSSLIIDICLIFTLVISLVIIFLLIEFRGGEKIDERRNG